MRNQFYYTKKDPIQPKEGETEIKFENVYMSFNINKVVKTAFLEDGRMIVMLDDFFEDIEKTPIYNKQGKITSYRNEKVTKQSNIYLDIDDADRFFKLTEIDYDENPFSQL